MNALRIRSATSRDAGQMAEIYNPYVLNSAISFEEEAVSVEQMSARLMDVTGRAFPWLVAEAEGVVAGYAYATEWKARRAYRYTVETTVYVAAEACGQGIGSQLYEALFSLLRTRGFHTAIGVIALPNDACVALHEKFGMKKVSHLRQAGFKFGKWHDVGNWQGML